MEFNPNLLWNKENKIYIIRELFIKLNVLLLVFGFLFQPVAPVFAKPETSAKASVSIKINDKADKTKPQLDKHQNKPKIYKQKPISSLL